MNKQDEEFDTISSPEELRKAYEDTPFLKDPKSRKKKPPFKDHEWGTDDPPVIKVRDGIPGSRKDKSTFLVDNNLALFLTIMGIGLIVFMAIIGLLAVLK